MESLALSIFDYVVIGIIILSGLIAFFKGFIQESLSLLLWIFAFAASIFLNEYLDSYFSDYINNQLEYIYQERAYDTSSNELPSFSLVNYNFNYKINNNFKSNFKISNILDQDYEVNRNYNTPGISFFGGIESEF